MTSRSKWLTHFILELENEAYRVELHSVDFTVDYESHDDIFYNDPNSNPINTNLDVYRLADKDNIWTITLFRESWKTWNNSFCDRCEIEIEGDYRKFKGWLAMFKLQNMDMNIKWKAYDWENDEDR